MADVALTDRQVEALTRLEALSRTDPTWLDDRLRTVVADLLAVLPRVGDAFRREAALRDVGAAIGADDVDAVTGDAVRAHVDAVKTEEGAGVASAAEAWDVLGGVHDAVHGMLTVDVPSYRGETRDWEEGARHGWTHALTHVRLLVRRRWPGIDAWTVASERAKVADDPRSLWGAGLRAMATAAVGALLDAASPRDWVAGRGEGDAWFVDSTGPGRPLVGTFRREADAKLVATAVNRYAAKHGPRVREAA